MSLNGTIGAVTDALNRAGVAWAAGGSVLLREYGLAAEPNDLDILVALPDAAASHEALRRLGQWERGAAKAPFRTAHFTGIGSAGTMWRLWPASASSTKRVCSTFRSTAAPLQQSGVEAGYLSRCWRTGGCCTL
ncbi:hypothetical protein [Gordoniibacillus kamchatkensis]|uniref:hypothetical protein n=1 Tax=Gordoniibacillus kamchatkensis TaxID=1590651 RepID=UPI000A6657C9|nr:hypothetical protein [Paenibacillus sp. VKM B-2647]